MVIALAVLSVLNATHFYVVGRERGGIEFGISGCRAT